MSFRPPLDSRNHECAKILLEPSEARDRLTAGIFITRDPNDVLGRLEDALPKVIAAEPLEKKLQAFVEAHPLLLGDIEAQLEKAVAANLLSATEAGVVRAAAAARRAVIAVDDFEKEAF